MYYAVCILVCTDMYVHKSILAQNHGVGHICIYKHVKFLWTNILGGWGLLNSTKLLMFFHLQSVPDIQQAEKPTALEWWIYPPHLLIANPHKARLAWKSLLVSLLPI